MLFFSGDIQYISRLVRLIKHFVPAGIIKPSMTGFIHGRYNMLPFDAFYDPITGERDMNRTTMVDVVLIFISIQVIIFLFQYVPNEYSIQLATEFPELFNPVGSVNPYRHDALDILEQLSQHGVTIIKWLVCYILFVLLHLSCFLIYSQIQWVLIHQMKNVSHFTTRSKN